RHGPRVAKQKTFPGRTGQFRFNADGGPKASPRCAVERFQLECDAVSGTKWRPQMRIGAARQKRLTIFWCRGTCQILPYTEQPASQWRKLNLIKCSATQLPHGCGQRSVQRH